MKLKPLNTMIGSQFFSALADNLAIFLVSASVTKYALGVVDEYTALAMNIYFIIYVLVSPWAGNIAERFPKGKIFIIANGFKLIFFLGILLKLNPAWMYGFFGLGSVLYSPAKYGILPFLSSDEKSLMRGNALVEGSTIIAIILGNVFGSKLSDEGILIATTVGIVLLGIGSLLAAFLPATPIRKIDVLREGMGNFIQDVKFFLFDRTGGGFFSVYGSVVFWMGTRVLQNFLFLWIPVVFMLEGNTPIGILIGIVAIGTIAGALASPRLISYWQGRRILFSGLAMGVGVLVISGVTNIYLLGILLFGIGFFGGLYLIPINSLNEHIGETKMGAGRAVAVQNFMENLFSSGALTLYTFARTFDISPKVLALGIGTIFILLLLALWPFKTEEKLKEQPEH